MIATRSDRWCAGSAVGADPFISGPLLVAWVLVGPGCVSTLFVGDGRHDGSGGGSAGEAGTASDIGATSSTPTTGVADATDTGTTDTGTGTTGSETTAGVEPPAATELSLAFSPVKQFDFSWPAAEGAEHYQLLESPSPGDPFVQLGADIVGESISLTMPLHLRYEASYSLRACNSAGCSTESAPVDVVAGSLVEAIGYVKASNTSTNSRFGAGVAVSGDGQTLAVGADLEDSSSTGIDGDQMNVGAVNSGAVYVFVRDAAGQWSQQAYVKASNTGAGDFFGYDVALSDDGNTLVVGAYIEESSATGVDGDQADNSNYGAGAVYVFVRDGAGQWSQQAYVKASTTGVNDAFGWSVAVSGDGDTLAAGAVGEASSATGIDGNQADDSTPYAGAAYVFVRDGAGQWSQQAYVKASNPDQEDWFGDDVALSDDGDTLAVGAPLEDSSATGIDGDQTDDSAIHTGAVFVFVRDGVDQWSQQAYVKASNPGSLDDFGLGVALSGDGDTLAVGARGEDSGATGIDGDQADESVLEAGAVYVLTRDAADQWSQQAYVKVPHPSVGTQLGWSVALGTEGDVLVASAVGEDSGAVGIDGDQADNSNGSTGAVFVFLRDPLDQWSQQAYLKASNTANLDNFAWRAAVTGDGTAIAVGALHEASAATGIGGNQADDSAPGAGAVYLY
jgi:hypothetical protein